MTKQQRAAIRRILRFYREHGGSNRSVRLDEIKLRGKVVNLKVKTRWDGDSDRLGAMYNYEGCYWIGPKGRIELIWSFGVSEQHAAFMLGAHMFRGRELKTRPSQYRGKKTHRVWELAEKLINRKQTIEAAVAEGINRNTASTQYYHWQRLQKACGRA